MEKPAIQLHVLQILAFGSDKFDGNGFEPTGEYEVTLNVQLGNGKYLKPIVIFIDKDGNQMIAEKE